MEDIGLKYAALAAKKERASNIFLLHNHRYDKAELFQLFDSVIVPSNFTRQYYQEKLGFDSRVISPLIDESKVISTENSKRFLTFINPSIEKGRYFFLGISTILSQKRPDIPILVVEGSSRTDNLKNISEIRNLNNLYSLPNVSDPRQIYGQTRVLLAPSLCEETFCRVAVEASFNKIPVVCSNRGALPEVIGTYLTRPIPSSFTVSTKRLSSEEEVAPWTHLIIRLWDDENFYQEMVEQSIEKTNPYRYDNVASTLKNFMQSLLN